MSLDNHNIVRSVRITNRYLIGLAAECKTNGIGKPAVFLRSLVAQQVAESEDKIEETCAIGRAVGNHGAPGRLSIRFDAEGDKVLQDVLERHTGGKFSVLVTGILAARYDNYELPAEEKDELKERRRRKLKVKKESLAE